MRIYWLALAWLAGITLAQQQAQLPGNVELIALVLASSLALICMVRTIALNTKPLAVESDEAGGLAPRQTSGFCNSPLRRIWGAVVVLAATAGLAFAWASVMAQWAMNARFPPQLENTEDVVRFQVTGLPTQMGSGLHTGVKVMVTIMAELQSPEPVPESESVPALSATTPHPFVSREVLLTWSGACTRGCHQKVRPGQVWRARLNWRAPHGYLNEYGPDTEQRLQQQGVAITARVRGVAVLEGQTQSPAFETRLSSIRHDIGQRMLDALDGKPLAGVLVALAIGDQQGISAQQWDWFSRVGISHLVAISGTHVSLLACVLGTLACWLFTRLRWRARSIVAWLPLAIVFAAAATVGAFAYCLLAGWGIPAQRTFYTLATAALVMSGRFGLRLATHDCLALALLILTALDPWAVLTSGLWLSFGAVASLLLMGQNTLKISGSAPTADQDQRQRHTQTRKRIRNLLGTLHTVVRLQWTVTLATLPLVATMFHVISLVSLPANLWAVTWISLVVTPLALTLALFAWLPLPDTWLVWPALLAHLCAEFALVPTQWLASLPFAVWEVAAGPVWLVILSMAGALIALVAPPGVGRSMGWLLLLPQMFWRPATPELGGWRLVAFDVGQGSAILIQTTNHQILFDTGWGTGDLDAVSRVVFPQLRAMGVKTLDDVIVSHPDMDHVGGLKSILRMREVTRLRGSGLAGYDYRPCRAGQNWSYDDVTFRMVAPLNQCATQNLTGAARNRCSCVLLVQGRWHKALLPGDIDAKVERSLLGLEAFEVVSKKSAPDGPRKSRARKARKISRGSARLESTRAESGRARSGRVESGRVKPGQRTKQHRKQQTKQHTRSVVETIPQKFAGTNLGKPDHSFKNARDQASPQGGSHACQAEPHMSDQRAAEKRAACEDLPGVSLMHLSPVDVVLMAHHGSVSSSDPAWVRALAPAHAIAQAGHHNRFGHPHPEVMARWSAQGARAWVSASDGSIRIESGQQGLVIVNARELRRRYWHASSSKVDASISERIP